MSTTEAYIWNYLKEKGLSDAGTAGLLGNLYAESGLNPQNLQDTYEKKLGYTDTGYTTAVDNNTYTNFIYDKAGYGLCQWTYWSRKQGLYLLCRDQGKSIGDLSAQLDYLYSELTQSYPSLLSILQTTTSVSIASNAVLLQFEQPADQSLTMQQKRVNYSQTYYDRYVTKGAIANMSYTNSSLITSTEKSPNHSGTRTHAIDRITPHCVVGQLTAQRIGQLFPSGVQASCNYAIGYDGSVCLVVDESNRSWCSSSSANDQRAVTIECASDTTDPYAFKDACYQKLIELCADICKRNGKTKLLWFGDKTTALNYTPASNEMVLTVHRWFANKACPGNWLYSRMDDLAAQVNQKLGTGAGASSSSNVNYQVKVTASSGLNCRVSASTSSSLVKTYPKGTILTITKESNQWGYTGEGWISLTYTEKIEEEEEMTQEKFNEMMNTYIENLANKDPTFEQSALDWAQKNGIILGDSKGRFMAKSYMTRGQLAVVLQRYNDYLKKQS